MILGRTLTICCAAILATTSALAQTPVPTDSAVAPAAATAPTAPAGPSVRFRQQPTQVGDRAVQRMAVHLPLATKITQSGQTAHESTNEMRRQQQRTIEVLEVADGRATKARASFQVSRRQAPENANPNELTAQPIEGKTYLMSRDGDRLNITDLEGAIPPLDEFKLVAESLENVGKPNPLAALLVNRRIALGQRILMPREMVEQLLGFQEIGTVHRFELTLKRVDSPTAKQPSPVAVFDAVIEVRPNDASPLNISLKGEMTLETETCRLVSVELAGPVQMSSIERTGAGIYQFFAGGELNVAIRSQYDRAVK
jgi:hypothetical protein